MSCTYTNIATSISVKLPFVPVLHSQSKLHWCKVWYNLQVTLVRRNTVSRTQQKFKREFAGRYYIEVAFTVVLS